MLKETPLLRVDQVNKLYTDGGQAVHTLDGVSFDVWGGEFVCLLGPSGSGKSTLLRIIGGLIPPSQGHVWFQGAPITEPHPDIGFVFQQTNLMPWRTVLQNVLLPVEVQSNGLDAETTERARALLDLVGLAEFVDAYPAKLSGGMKQRVVLARALMQQPQLLLMDEPFGALDALTRERLNVEMLRMQQIHASTVLMVTHSIAEAVFLADRVLVFSPRPGRICAQVAVDLPRPRSLSLLGDDRFTRLTMQIRRHINAREVSGAPASH